jgi:hypothetical protein
MSSYGRTVAALVVAILGTTTFVVGQEQYSADAGGSGAGSDLSGVAGLEVNIPGLPGEDYPIYAEVPDTGFTCDGLVEGGYYADPAAECQAFHICANDGNEGLRTYSVLCPNGTVFNQGVFVCDWWFNFDCAEAEGLYGLNDENAAEAAAASEASGQASYESLRIRR